MNCEIHHANQHGLSVNAETFRYKTGRNLFSCLRIKRPAYGRSGNIDEDGSKMSFLNRERSTLETFLPGLDTALAAIPLLEMERIGNPSIAAFRKLGGPGLLIPARFGGRGASPLDAARVQRAIGSRAPSLAVATTMHHFTIATLMAISPDESGPEGELLASIAQGNLYVASGFAEGKTGVSIQTSALSVKRSASGFILNGSKKPCSLSHSMDLFTASTPAPEGMDAGLAVVVIPADAPGIERQPFWRSPILAGAESDEVILRDVSVAEEDFVPLGGPGRSDIVQDRGFLWFELLITASYLGIASGLVERVLLSRQGGATERVSLASEVEGGMAALEGIAQAMVAGECGNDELARMLLVRYAAQAAIDRAASLAFELLGGMAFIKSPEIAYLTAAARALSLHPPSRLAAGKRLDQYLAGSPLVLD
jgi:alkylation response protein AidB-like acyl-CoA dehydrogenase